MRVLFFLITLSLFITSCQKTYTYVEFKDNGETTSEKIKSDNDSTAYFKAFTKFEISKLATKNVAEHTNTKPPYIATSFQILFKNKPIIANFKDQENNELRIIEMVNALRENSEKNTEPKQVTQVDSLKIKALTPKFNFEKDEFSNNNQVWVKHKSNPKYIDTNSVNLYFASTNNKPNNLRFVIQYTAKDWLFFKNVKFSIDEEAYSYIPSNIKTDHGNGKIWEWSDQQITSSNEINLIKALANAKKAKIKLEGRNYYKVIDIPQKQINAIKETLELYISSGGIL